MGTNLPFSTCVLVILGFCSQGSLALNVIATHVSGPDRDLFPGDFEEFTCHSGAPEIKWVYNLGKEGKQDAQASDIMENYNTSKGYGKTYRSLIRILPKADRIYCMDAQEGGEVGNVPVTVMNEFEVVNPLQELDCQDAPKVMMKRWDRVSRNHVWMPHVVTDKEVHIPEGVSGLKLSCYSKSNVTWSIVKKELFDFEYRTSEHHNCFFASLVLSPLNPTSGQVFTCSSVSGGKATVDLVLPPSRTTPSGDPVHVLDFNKTQECIEYLGTTVFGSQTLAWSTAGSGLLSIGMMVGVVFLKKQLEKQKHSNGNLVNNNGSTP